MRSRRSGRSTRSAASHAPSAGEPPARSGRAREQAVSSCDWRLLQRRERADDLQPREAAETGIAQRRDVGAVARAAGASKVCSPRAQARARGRRGAGVEQRRVPPSVRRSELPDADEHGVEAPVVLGELLLDGGQRGRRARARRCARGGRRARRARRRRRRARRPRPPPAARRPRRATTPSVRRPRRLRTGAQTSQDEADAAHGVRARAARRRPRACGAGSRRRRRRRSCPDRTCSPRPPRGAGGASSDLARVAHEEREQLELAARELERALAAVGAARARVEPQVADLQRLALAGGAAAQQRLQRARRPPRIANGLTM